MRSQRYICDFMLELAHILQTVSLRSIEYRAAPKGLTIPILAHDNQLLDDVDDLKEDYVVYFNNKSNYHKSMYQRCTVYCAPVYIRTEMIYQYFCVVGGLILRRTKFFTLTINYQQSMFQKCASRLHPYLNDKPVYLCCRWSCIRLEPRFYGNSHSSVRRRYCIWNNMFKNVKENATTGKIY